MKAYGVKRLSELSGVSVRTLHHYDKIGLLKPSIRTEKRYRLYGEKELLRLQQILFYKELDFSLQEIADLLDDPAFDVVKALEQHKDALQQRRARMDTLLATLDKTIQKLNGTMMLNDEELYEGLPKEKAAAYKKEAQERYGQATVEQSELYLKKMDKESMNRLKSELIYVVRGLHGLKALDPSDKKVQALVDRHYHIIRQFWGTVDDVDKQAEAYKGLGDLYREDERFIVSMLGHPDPTFASFLRAAMGLYAQQRL